MQPILQRMDSPKYALAITAIIYAAYILSRLASTGYDPSFFIVAGDKAAISGEAPGNLHIINNSAGYDGQFYYRLALTPFTSQYREFGVVLDDPPYRQQRILYPLLVWAFSLGGNPLLVPAMMMLVNFLALCLIAWVGAMYSQSAGKHALYGALFALFPGFIITLSRDTTEIIAALFLLSALLLLQKGKHLYAAISLSLAVLARETSLLFAICVIAVHIIEQFSKKARATWLPLLLPFIAFAAMQALMYYNWHTLPLYSDRGNLAAPLSGVVYFYNSLAGLDPRLKYLGYAELAFIAIFTTSVILKVFPSAARIYGKLSWFFYSYLMVLIDTVMWETHWGFMRAFTEPFLFGTAILISSQNKSRAIKISAFASLLLSAWLMLKLINEP